jgi:hypothetical protein
MKTPFLERLTGVRPVFHAALLLFVLSYILLIPFGRVDKDNRWTAEEVVLIAVLVVASSGLLDTLRYLKIGKDGLSAQFQRIERRQEDQEERLTRQALEIRTLRMVLQGITTRYELDKLVGLCKEEPFLCYYSDELFDEVKRLRAMGLVQNHEGVGLTAMKNEYKDKKKQFDLKRFFFITEQGREYLRLRAEVMQVTAGPGPQG